MSFKDEFDQHQKDTATNGDFFKFKKDGDYKFRIMTEPLKKVSRYGFGICYEGAPYCQKDALEADYKKAQEKAKAEGKDVSKVTKPALSVKWMVWAFEYVSGKFVVLDMSNPVANALREMMDSDEYGFKDFPMPYDITIKVKNAGLKSAEYSVLAARKNTDIDPALLEDFAKLTPIEQLKEKLQTKQRERIDGQSSLEEMAEQNGSMDEFGGDNDPTL